MKRCFLAMMTAMVMVFGMVTMAASAEQPMAGGESRFLETFNGKILTVENDLYVIELSPGRERRVTFGKDTKIEGDIKPQKGDWIEASITREGRAKAIKKGKPGYTVEGDLLKVDGEFYTVTDLAGKEVKLHVNKETAMEGTHKVGERILAVVTPEGHALSIKPARPQRMDPGTTFMP